MMLTRGTPTICFCLTLLLFQLPAFGATQSGSDLNLIWSEDGDLCIYKTNQQFLLIDVEKKSKTPLFSDQQLREIGSVSDVVFGDSAGEFILKNESKFFLLDRSKGSVSPLKHSASSKFPSRLSLPVRGSVNGGPQTTLELKNATDEALQIFWVDNQRNERPYGTVEPSKSFRQNTYVGHEWLLKSQNGGALGSFRTQSNESVVVDAAMLERVRRNNRSAPRKRATHLYSASRSPKSPDSNWQTSVIDNNLILKSLKTKNVEQIDLSKDGTPAHTFENIGDGTYWFDSPRGADVRWSPSSKFVAAFQTKNPPAPVVRLVESTPAGQLQPTIRQFTYPKPGDALPQKSLRLFSIEENTEIPVSNELFSNPWSLKFVRWTGEGEKFWLLYNQRGHQVVRLVEVDASTGNSTVLIEEASDSFIHYSNPTKSLFELLPDGTILWASERSGWNHLYRFDPDDGKLISAVTQGQWNVKRIHEIDFDRSVIWFFAVGVVSSQDPYHEHFCRVNLDGSGFKVLTDGDGTHEVQFQRDKKYFADTWSRVDQAPVTELRHSQTGEIIVELGRQDSKTLFGDRRLPTRFSAKGRDGQTDIWGIIHWPKDFDENQIYPVVENIYAGPHDHHVPKKFASGYRTEHSIADTGMIVVQIDGMGTAWRSKAFHDVCHKNLKDAGLPDRIEWIKAAARNYPQMDLSRVGIYGGSAGGQSAMAALLWHNDFYKVAVADCGCHDNRMDKIWWNEQWMGWPVDESYTENSNTENAHLLKGNLMLIVGELDNNVDPASTTQVVRKLIEHDKDFEFVLVAGAGHGAAETQWGSKKRLGFLRKHLLQMDASR